MPCASRLQAMIDPDGLVARSHVNKVDTGDRVRHRSPMRVTLRKMGNSSGVIIPKPFLAEIGAAQAVEMSLEDGRIVIEADKRAPRFGWAEASRGLALDEEGLVWPEFGNADDETLEW
jgi:antitoxin MazE